MPLDAGQALIFRGALISRPNVDAIPLPVSGHGVLHTLRDLGLVRKLIEALIQEDNQELVSEIRQEFRIRKRSSFNYYFALADRLMTQKRYQSASTFLRKSIEINPSFHMSYSLLGEALWNLGEQDEALQSLARACELAPTNGGHRIQFGNRLIELNRLDEAINVFETAIKEFPDLSPARSGLATALTQQSLKCLQRASELYAMALKDNQRPIRWNLDAAYVESLLRNWDRSRLLLAEAAEAGYDPAQIAEIAAVMPG